MIAVESGEDLASGAVYQGDVSITVNLASNAPSVGVSFDHMINLTTPTVSVDDMDWDGLAMTGGFKVASTAPAMRKPGVLSSAICWLAPSGPRGRVMRPRFGAGMVGATPSVGEDSASAASRLWLRT